MPKLSIVIPVYFNADTLPILYKELKNNLFSKLDNYEVVMVDDGSQDNSWKEMKHIARMDQNVKLIRLSRNFGSHAAILAGLSACTGDCATIKAADLQEPTELILEMYESWKRGNKVVLAIRQAREESIMRKAFADMYYMLMRKMAISSMPKHGFDCFLIDRKVIEVLKLLDEKNSAITMQILWAGFQREEISYIRQKRNIGKSKWTLAKKIKLAVDSIVSFSFVPIRFVSFIGILVFVISFLWGIIVLCGKLFIGIDVEGWTSLMIVVLISSGLVMLTLGVLGEYLWRIMDAARNRPVYIIDESQD